MIKAVVLSKNAERQVITIPTYIREKLLSWIAAIREKGLENVRVVPGFHDEPLQGRLTGLRSVRLSRSYRAYYRIVHGQVDLVYVERVDKHEY